MGALKVKVLLFGLLLNFSSCANNNNGAPPQGQCDGSKNDASAQAQCNGNSPFSNDVASTREQCNEPCDSKSCCPPKSKCVVDPNEDLGFRCTCPDGFTGLNCKSKASVCKSNPCCKPKTQCVVDENAVGGYRCACPKGKIGLKCQFSGPCESTESGNTDPTSSELCSNSGTCVQTNDFGGYRCDCDSCHVGSYCQFDDPCSSQHDSPCQNGGTCKSDKITGKFTCECKPDFNGLRCQFKDPCSSNPCHDHGLCVSDFKGNYQCICDNEFDESTNCEKNKTCNNCTHCAKCDEGGGNVKFYCKTGFTGEYCDQKVNCSQYPCENGGTCIVSLPQNEEDLNYVCSCKAGFHGKNCEIIEFGCDQDIITNINTDENDLPNLETPVPGRKVKPAKKHFCPVVQTVRKRDGCKKCSAGKDNCEGCCNDKKARCDEQCQLLGDLTSCCDAEANKEKEACQEQDSLKARYHQSCETEEGESKCDVEAKECKNKCTEDTNGDLTPCPKIYTCKEARDSENSICRAFKFPSGKIACVIVDDKSINTKNEFHSYIRYPRIHFAGKVEIDTATLNNVVSNYDAKTFAPVKAVIDGTNWNPSGSNGFRFVDVSVTRVCDKDGLCVYRSLDDPLCNSSVKDQANGKVAAKIVDLDIEVQGRVSEIYGLSLDVGGFFKGDMEHASFQSLWYKIIEKNEEKFGSRKGSRFQSVLNNVMFSTSKVEKSNIAKQFENLIGPNRKLSICFNIDLLSERPYSNFSFARIVGSIGLSGEKAPPFFDHGRLLRRLPATSELYNAPITVDANNYKIYIDLGNSLAMDINGNVLSSIGLLRLGVYNNQQGIDNLACSDQISWIDNVYYNDNGGYTFTSGITVLNIPKEKFTSENLKKQLVLAMVDESNVCQKILLAENKSGIYVRSLSHFLFRAQYSEVITGNLFVTIFGEKYNDEDIGLELKTSTSIIKSHGQNPSQSFCLEFQNEAKVYKYFFFAMNDPADRRIIEGQIYTLQYTFNGYPLNSDRDEAMSSAIFIKVYSEFTTSEGTTWISDVRPIFQVYANLFPVMSTFVDLGSYNSVVRKKCHILTAMSLDFQDPQFMPVTRDLSVKKTEMILKWLDEDKPELGLKHEIQLSKQHLIDMLQTALQLEHATIPIYLNGYLSIKPWQNEEVKDMLLNIIVDEMFHFAQVANIINGLGGRPYLLGKTFVPSFPSHLPGGCRPNVMASIDKISLQQIHDVYMEIEEPSYVLKEHDLVPLIKKINQARKRTQAAREGPQADRSSGDPEDKCEKSLKYFALPDKKLTDTNHETIGDLYMSIVYVLVQLSNCGEKDIFNSRTRQLKWNDARRLREVSNFEDALKAIEMIVDEGEGASPYNPLQQMTGSSRLSHYFKFSTLFHGRKILTFNVTHEDVYRNKDKALYQNYAFVGDKVSFFETGVWPVVKDPMMSKYKKDSMAYRNAEAFNNLYSKLLETLQSVFDGNVDRFDDTFGLMKSLVVYGRRVVQTPIDEDGDPHVGPNAGPTYFN